MISQFCCTSLMSLHFAAVSGLMSVRDGGAVLGEGWGGGGGEWEGGWAGWEGEGEQNTPKWSPSQSFHISPATCRKQTIPMFITDTSTRSSYKKNEVSLVSWVL